MEHMDSIAEEKSELAMDTAQPVMEKLDIDRKLDKRTNVLLHRGGRIVAWCTRASWCRDSREEHGFVVRRMMW